MSYTLQKFANGEVLHDQHLNHIEEGIVANEKRIDSLQEHTINVPDIEDLRNIIGYKKNITCEDLRNLEESIEGTVYKLMDSLENIESFNSTYEVSFNNKDYIFCRKSFSEPVSDIKGFWSNRTSFTQEASKGYAGIVTSEDQEFSGKKSFEDIDTLNIVSTTASFEELHASSLQLDSPDVTVDTETYIIPKEGEIQTLRDQLASSESNTSESLNLISQQIELLREDLEELQNNTASPEVLQQKVKDIEGRLESIENLNLSQNINDLWAKVGNIVDVDSFESLKDNVDELTKITTSKVGYDNFNSTISSILTNLNKLDTSVISATARVTALESSYTTVNSTLEAQSETLDSLILSLSKLEVSLEALEKIVNSGSFPSDPDSPGIDSTVIQALEVKITNLNTEIEKLNGRIIAGIDQAVTDVTSSFKEADDTINQRIDNTNAKLSSSISSLETRVGTSSSGLTKDVSDLKNHVNINHESRINKSESDIKALQDKDSELHKALYGDDSSENPSGKSGVLSRLANLETTDSTTSTTLTNLGTRLQKVEEANSTQNTSISTNTTSIDTLGKRVTENERDIEANKREAQDNLEASYGLIDTYTQNGYNSLIATSTYKTNKLYAINNGPGTRITKIYLGSVLLAMRDEAGNTSFPYTFPIRF